ncbi:hypothetical protein AAFN60_02045 [Roseibacillus persicicus]|uniref:hypothetical protein n=1 Tax=Roseibacillus persicicus TaxID=454148 RepID=UPI00398B6355
MLSSLSSLKQHVLFDGLDDATDWDTQLQTVGESVLAQFERHTNRRLTRTVDEAYRRSGGIDCLILRALPVESIGTLSLNGDDLSADNIRYWDAPSGMVQFESYLGTPRDLITLNHTGGYWVDANDDVSELPSGATVVPSDLLHAWHLQVQATIEFTNLLYSGAARPDGETSPALPGLTEAVTHLLRPYRRNS